MSQGGTFRRLPTTFVSDSGEAVATEVGLGSEIEFLGAGTVTTSASGNTVTITGTGASSTTFTCDSGSATASGGAINILGSGATTSGSGNTITITATAGSSVTYIARWNAEALDSLETNFAAPENITTTNIKQKVRSYDYATVEYANGRFVVPDLDTTATVTLVVWWIARTVPSPSEDVVWQFDHVATGEADLDGLSYTSVDFDPSGTTTTQNYLVKATKTISAATLAWTAGQNVYVRWVRDATNVLDTFDSQADTNDDALLVAAEIHMPGV